MKSMKMTWLIQLEFYNKVRCISYSKLTGFQTNSIDLIRRILRYSRIVFQITGEVRDKNAITQFLEFSLLQKILDKSTVKLMCDPFIATPTRYIISLLLA